jgi:hypothetical protein
VLGGPAPIARQEFTTKHLMQTHSPVLRDRNKKVVFEIACPQGCSHAGELRYSRWAPMGLPRVVDGQSAAKRVEGRSGFYDYVAAVGTGVEWHVNFADPNLFFASGSSLLAQDEIQVAEHPALGALREALESSGHVALTVEGGRPTPILVMGVERRCHVATDQNRQEGRPHGLYGNMFARADESVVRRATRPIAPPTTTNLIAIAAPNGGSGRYSEREIEFVLTTAFTSFRAAVLESARHCGDHLPVVVHTGFWGCGAFGGNRVLMATLQMLAAEMARLERLVFHTGDGSGSKSLEEAGLLLKDRLAIGSPMDTGAVIKRIAAWGLEWGAGDGT